MISSLLTKQTVKCLSHLTIEMYTGYIMPFGIKCPCYSTKCRFVYCSSYSNAYRHSLNALTCCSCRNFFLKCGVGWIINKRCSSGNERTVFLGVGLWPFFSVDQVKVIYLLKSGRSESIRDILSVNLFPLILFCLFFWIIWTFADVTYAWLLNIVYFVYLAIHLIIIVLERPSKGNTIKI